MSSPNKRRKLNAVSAPAHLSAFAARNALLSQAGSPSKAVKDHDGDAPVEEFTMNPTSVAFGLAETEPEAEKEVIDSEIATQKPHSRGIFMDPDENIQLPSYVQYTLLLAGTSSAADYLFRTFEPRAESFEILAERPSITLSSFMPSKDTIREFGNDALFIRLAPGERLVVLGQFEISIHKGQITIMGSTLRSSKQTYRVFAPCSHSLPVIRCLATDVEGAEIRLHQYDAGLGSLEVLSPLFSKLWNDNSGPLGIEYARLIQNTKRSTFQILFSSNDGPSRAYLQPLISPPEWNEMLARFSMRKGATPLAIMICGPKSSGKSTFAKLLANKLVSEATHIPKPTKGVALLDLDPGQPEYSPPGQLSLIFVVEPNFGPPFAHPIPDARNKVIRSHSIAAISPSLDPNLYMACVADLFAHYNNLLSTEPGCPLVINTPGWVLGTGLEILVEMITKVRPSEIIYMSKDGPAEVVESLQDAARSTPVLALPSQISEYAARTAAHLRTMQSMSYLHLDLNRKRGMAWSSLPLTSISPWEIKYYGENPGMLGVMCYGEQPPPSLLADTINGSLVAVVVIDDMTAIPGWSPEGEEDTELSFLSSESIMRTDDTEIRAFDQDSLQPQRLERPLIVHTPKEEIPYFNPANAISLNPRYSHSIGLALIRGIDSAHHRLQILTPIAPNVVEEVNEAGKSIVLISGKLDTPGWAYIEGLTQKIALDKAMRRMGSTSMGFEDGVWETDADVGMDLDERRILSDAFQNAPWIDRLEGSQGRGIGARVWRVRRDLGKNGEGTD